MVDFYGKVNIPHMDAMGMGHTFFYTTHPKFERQKMLQKHNPRSPNKITESRVSFCWRGCLSEGFFPKCISCNLYYCRSGNLPRKKSDYPPQQKTTNYTTSSVPNHNREAFCSIPSAEDIETKIVHRRSMIRTWRWLFSRGLHREPTICWEVKPM